MQLEGSRYPQIFQPQDRHRPTFCCRDNEVVFVHFIAANRSDGLDFKSIAVRPMPFDQQPPVLPNLIAGHQRIATKPQAKMQKFHHSAARNPDPVDRLRMGRIHLEAQHGLVRASCPSHPSAWRIRHAFTQIGQATCAGSAHRLEPMLPEQVNQPDQRSTGTCQNRSTHLCKP